MDLYLEALMKGKASFTLSQRNKEVSPYDVIIEEELTKYLNSQVFEFNPQNQFMPPELQRSRKKAEMKEILCMRETEKQVVAALNLIIQNQNYFSKDHYEQILNDLSMIAANLDSPSTSEDKDLKTLGNLSEQTLEAISHLALKKFGDQQYQDCLNLFTLLSFLNPGDPEVWFRAAIASYYLELEDLALNYYSITLYLNPNFIPAYLFLAECFFKKGMIPEGLTELDKAKKVIISSPEQSNDWEKLIFELEESIKI